MEETYLTKAIILKRVVFRESDIKTTVFCFDRGKIDLIVRGAKKMGSKMAGHSEPFNIAKIMVVRGRQFDYAGNIVNEEIFSNIKNNLEKIVWASKAVSDFNRAVKGAEASDAKELYDLLAGYLIEENSGKTKSDLNYYVFLYKLLTLLGYRPELKQCVVCGGKTEEDKLEFSLAKSGLICQNCREPGALQISRKAVVLLDSKIILNGDNQDLKFIETYFKYIFN